MILDDIEIAIKKAKKEGKTPHYLNLDRFTYAQLLEARNMETEDIKVHGGLKVLISPEDEGKIEIL